MEVTHTFVGDSRELGEVRAAEAKLREQVGCGCQPILGVFLSVYFLKIAGGRV